MFEELEEIGFTENEIQIYVVLLKLGTSTPAKIAEKTGFSRSYVYDALQRLLEKEMVNSVYIKNKKHFQATNPKQISELIKVKLNKIKSTIPKLLEFIKPTKEEIHVELHKGKYVYKVLLRDITSILKRKGEVLIYGIDDDVLIELDPYYLTHLKIYFSALKKKGIREKVIVKENARTLKEAKTTEYKFLPKEVIGNTAFEVYNNKVAIFLWGIPNYLILIENKEVANSYRKQFNTLWKIAEKS